MEPDKELVGIVIRADGTVPFDEDVPHEFRSKVIAHLVDQGHDLETIPDSRHVRIKNFSKKVA